MQRAARLAAWTVLGALLAVTGWYRVTSLEAFPPPNGDEAWYGVQAWHLLHGRSFDWHTPNGNVLNPFHIGLEVPLLAAFGPRHWVLRAPSVLGGILTVVLAWRLGRRVLDRPTALATAGLFACLPVTIHYSRVGFDCSQTPLWSLLLVFAAWETRPWAVLATLVVSYLAHPTNIFLIPIVAPLAFRQAWSAGDLAGRRHRVLGMALALGVPGLLGGLRLLSQRLVHVMYEYEILHSRDPFEAVHRLGRLLLGGWLDARPAPIQDAALGLVVLVLALVGGREWLRRRAWDRLALAGGLVLGFGAFLAIVGSDALRPERHRYGLAFVTPTILVVAGLATATFDRLQALAPRLAALGPPLAAAVAVGLLACYHHNLVAPTQSLRPPRVPGQYEDDYIRASGVDSPWSWGSDEPHRAQAAFRLIDRDLRRRAAAGDVEPGRPVGIVAQDWWAWRLLQYQAVDRPSWRVVDFLRLDDDPEQQYFRTNQLLERGAYAVLLADGNPERWVTGCYGNRLVRWDVPNPSGPFLRIYRLRDAPPPAVAATPGRPVR